MSLPTKAASVFICLFYSHSSQPQTRRSSALFQLKFCLFIKVGSGHTACVCSDSGPAQSDVLMSGLLLWDPPPCPPRSSFSCTVLAAVSPRPPASQSPVLSARPIVLQTAQVMINTNTQQWELQRTASVGVERLEAGTRRRRRCHGDTRRRGERASEMSLSFGLSCQENWRRTHIK